MKIEIGRVLKAQGIRGELKLGCSVDSADMLTKVKTMYIDGRTYEVSRFRGNGSFCFVTLDGVATRNDAEELRNKVVYADKEQVKLAPDRYFVEDLVGCEVLTNGKIVGKVSDLLQYGAADVFVCDGVDGKGFSFPFLKDVVSAVDIVGKQITVDEKRFAEVVVYED